MEAIPITMVSFLLPQEGTGTKSELKTRKQLLKTVYLGTLMKQFMYMLIIDMEILLWIL